MPQPLAPPPTISVRAARLGYPGIRVFDGLDLDIAAARWTCVLGPSGVGKSSLLRLIAGTAEAAQGEVRGADGTSVKGRIAYMAQGDLLLPWLSVLDNVVLGARLRGEARDRARATALLGRLGLGERIHARPAALSGGMRQRCALARTLMEPRPVVLMDEPFSALDAITRYRLQALAAEELAGRTVLLVTHDPFEALRLGHHIHVMAGRPARIERALTLETPIPRELGTADMAALHEALLARLAHADGAAP